VYFGFFALVSIGNPRTLAEMFREPFVQSALFLAFFMLTDPPTSPNRYGDQVWFGSLAAVSAGVAQLLGAGQVFLLLGVLVSNAALATVRWWRRRQSTTAEDARADSLRTCASLPQPQSPF
jgi:Na+-translocating ferredoxin:NAD+ oxidoreductase RnfD subunit